MPYFDLVLAIIIGAFGLFGLWFGLVRTVGSLLGTVLGIFLATRFYEPVANWVIGFTGWSQNFSKVIIFIIVFLLITKLVGVIFWLLEKALSVVTHLPVIRGLDRILGLVFGIAEGAIFVGVVLYFIARFPLGSTFMQALAQSRIAPSLVKIASILLPLVPTAIKMIKSTVDGIL